jgi:hypothetical protein
MMRGVQTRSAADIARELNIHWLVHRIVLDKLGYREVCAHWGPKDATDDDKTRCIGHVTLIKESKFGAETWIITRNQKKKHLIRETVLGP